MGHATTETGYDSNGKGGEVRIIRTEVIGSTLVNVIQTSIVETAQYVGLDETTAKGLASKYDAQSAASGLIKTSLGGIRVTVGLSWFSVFGCRGTIETAHASQVGNTNLWNVDYQMVTLSVTADGGTVEEI